MTRVTSTSRGRRTWTARAGASGSTTFPTSRCTVSRSTARSSATSTTGRSRGRAAELTTAAYDERKVEAGASLRLEGTMTDRAQLEREPRQNVFAAQRVRLAEYRLAAVGAVYARVDADGVHDPHRRAPAFSQSPTFASTS